MKSIDLGFTHGTTELPSEPSKEQEPIYPSMSIQGEPAKALKEQVKVGDTITGTFTMKVVGIRDGGRYENGNCSIELDVSEITPDNVSGGEEPMPSDEVEDEFDKFETDMASKSEDGEHEYRD